MALSRRDLVPATISSLLVLTLARRAVGAQAIGRKIAPNVIAWLKRIDDLGRSVKDRTISQPAWQSAMGELFRTVELPVFLRFIDFERLASHTVLPSSGESFVETELPEVEGLPDDTAFFTALAGFGKGRSIPPHGHNHLVSSFLVLRGKLRGRQFDRVVDEGEYLRVVPTVDRLFGPGDFSTVSQARDNVHWFTAETHGAFVFDFGVAGLPETGITQPLPGNDPRIYLDMHQAERLPAGQQRVKRISRAAAYRLYG